MTVSPSPGPLLWVHSPTASMWCQNMVSDAVYTKLPRHVQAMLSLSGVSFVSGSTIGAQTYRSDAVCVCVRVNRGRVRARVSRETRASRTRTERSRAEGQARCRSHGQTHRTHGQGEGAGADEGRQISPCLVCLLHLRFMSFGIHTHCETTKTPIH